MRWGIGWKANKNFTFPLLLSGDTHHYSRYQAADGTQLITSGGGGAFLHPTHQLEDTADLGWVTTRKQISLATLGNKNTEAAVYPSMATSRDLVWGNFWFAFKNADFSLLMAVVYLIVGVLIGIRNEIDTQIFVLCIFAAAIVSYTTSQEKVSLGEIYAEWKKRSRDVKGYGTAATTRLWLQFKKASVVWMTSLAHVGAQFWASTASAQWAFANGPAPASQFPDVWYWLAWLAVTCGSVGFLAGSSIFGLNMLYTCRWLRMNRNDAFSALRIGRFNNFVRLRINGDEVEVFTVGLDEVPERSDWKANPNYKIGNSSEPRWIPEVPLKPHLVERFVVKGSTTPMPNYP